MKICNKCNQEKIITDFSKHKTCNDGYENICKECKNILAKKHYINNIEIKKQYYLNNKDKFAERSKKYGNTIKEYHIKHKDKIKEYYSKWREENKVILSEKQREYNKSRQKIRNSQDIERRKNDPQFKIACAIRGMICKSLKKNKTSKTTELLGCSLKYFKNHLETQFKPEMNWDNYALCWEVDHIKPCDSFDLTDIEQQKQCFHYTNTQPLFKTTEIAKSFGYINEIGNRNKSNKYE
jgi:hypothetical protein